MTQRGRKSAASLSVVAQMPVRMLEPPPDLSPECAEVWAGVVAEKPQAYFDAGSIPLLAQYCRVVVQAQNIGLQIEAVAPHIGDDEALQRYEKLRKLQAQVSAELACLATKLRLSIQAKYRGESNIVNGKASRKPWQCSED